MTVNFKHFLDSRRNLDSLPAKEEALLQGAVFEHIGQRYHVQILPTGTENGEKASLIFRIYTGTKHEIRCFDEVNAYCTFIGEKRFEERAAPLTQTFYNIILLGTITEETEDLIFGGKLTAEETKFYKTHQELMPRMTEEVDKVIITYAYAASYAGEGHQKGNGGRGEPLNTGWTSPQKASLLLVTILATMTIVYGAKKAVNHYDLKAPNVPTLEDLKASLEKLRNWRKGAALA